MVKQHRAIPARLRRLPPPTPVPLRLPSNPPPPPLPALSLSLGTQPRSASRRFAPEANAGGQIQPAVYWSNPAGGLLVKSSQRSTGMMSAQARGQISERPTRILVKSGKWSNSTCRRCTSLAVRSLKTGPSVAAPPAPAAVAAPPEGGPAAEGRGGLLQRRASGQETATRILRATRISSG